jgi:hypothetical protein
MTNNQPDIPSLQLEVLKNIQAELSGLRGEVTALRKDLDTGLADVRTELRDGLGDLRDEMHEGFMRVRTELVGLRDEVEVGFTATRMQNDRRFLDHERRLRDLENR